MDMAETAKNRTEQCKQQLHSSLKPPSKPSSSSGASTLSTTSVKTVKSGSSSKSYDSDTSHSTTSPSKLATVSTTSTNVKAVKSGSSSKLHDSESHSSTPTKIAKASSETSVSSVDNSPSKKSKPRDKDKDKSDRDRRSRGKNEKSEKSKDKDRHESKEKESRHSRHRDKKRHGESSKDKEKIRNREAESDGGGPEAPPVKKSRTGKDTPHGNFNEYYAFSNFTIAIIYLPIIFYKCVSICDENSNEFKVCTCFTFLMIRANDVLQSSQENEKYYFKTENSLYEGILSNSSCNFLRYRKILPRSMLALGVKKMSNDE